MFAMGMIHAGEQGSGGGLLIQPDMGLAASYSASAIELAEEAIAILTLTIKRNGQWIIEVSGSSSVNGGGGSGNWGSPNQATAGDDYEVLVAVNSGSGGSFSNDAPVYTRLNADRVVQLSVNDNTFNSGSTQTGSRNLTITVRKKGTTTPVSTDTVDFSVSAEWNNL